MNPENHPTVRKYRGRANHEESAGRTDPLEAGWLRKLCLEAGADDAGFCSLESPRLGSWRDLALELMPPRPGP